MKSRRSRRCTAFAGTERIASGPILEVALAVKERMSRGRREPILAFDDATGRRVDLAVSGSREEIRARFAEEEHEAGGGHARRGPGRPRLGVVPKEVTLLPRHWAWLSAQRGGASATLRRLVDEARKKHEQRDRGRAAQDAAYRFMSAMGGDLPGFEEAIRALYRRDRAKFEGETRSWPKDLREHAATLAAPAFRAAATKDKPDAG